MARTQGSHAQITGPRIRKAALGLFAEHGYAAVSMRQIARAVGLQAGALYNYIPDKQTLLFSLLRGHMDELLTAWEAEDKGHGPEARLAAFVRFHIAFHLDRPQEVFISYMELRNLTPEHFAQIEALRKRYEDALEGILQQGDATGVFTIEDSKLATLAVIGMLNGVLTWYRPDGRLALDEVAELYRQMVHKSVASKDTGGRPSGITHRA